MKPSDSGFTIIELLITVAMAAILAALAMPSFSDLMSKRNVVAVSDTLISDLRYARSEALKRTTPVTVCQSLNSASCTVNPGAWVGGWITFIDFNGNGTVDAGDTLLRVQAAPSGIQSIQNNPINDRTFFTYQANGVAKAANQTFFIVPTGGAAANLTRLVCISVAGRASLRAEGSNACT